jgi:hypothetical protein
MHDASDAAQALSNKKARRLPRLGVALLTGVSLFWPLES